MRHSQTPHRLGRISGPLKLPIDPDEVHLSDRVVTMDMPLLTWGKTKPICNKASQLLKFGRYAGEK
jgi:hypothetical protein